MTRRTHGIRTAATTGLVVIGLFSACACTPEERRVATRSAALAAVSSVTTTAGGQTTTPTPNPPPRPGRWVGVKPNGRGGFDASVAQKAALAKAHYMRDHHNDVIKPFRPSTRPTARPTTLGR